MPQALLKSRKATSTCVLVSGGEQIVYGRKQLNFTSEAGAESMV